MRIELSNAANTVSYASSAAGVMVAGNGGNDDLTGSAHADSFNGGAGNDTLRGGGGDDQLRGGEGVDRVQGGAGNDSFFFAKTDLMPLAGGQIDHVQDFAGSGGYSAWQGTEDDMLVFEGFAAGSIVFNRLSGGDPSLHIYDLFDGGIYAGSIAVQMKGSTSQLDIGDYRFI